MTTIEELYAQRQAMMSDPRLAAVGTAQQAQAQALRNDLAQRHHPDLLARLVAVQQERHQLGGELQECQHSLAALDQVTPEKGDEDAHDQKAGLLAARERRLTRAAQQLDQTLAQLDADLSNAVARAAAQRAQQWKTEYNRLIRERAAALDDVERAKQAVITKYAGSIEAASQQLVALSTLTPVDLDPVAGGLLREA